jgi:hypothetical protein
LIDTTGAPTAATVDTFDAESSMNWLSGALRL